MQVDTAIMKSIINEERSTQTPLKGVITLKSPVFFGITQKQYHYMTHPLQEDGMVQKLSV